MAKEDWALIGVGFNKEKGVRVWVLEGKEKTKVEGLKRVVVDLGKGNKEERYLSFILNEYVTCPECGYSLMITRELRFCPKCGTQLFD
jgi:rubrerythrin